MSSQLTLKIKAISIQKDLRSCSDFAVFFLRFYFTFSAFREGKRWVGKEPSQVKGTEVLLKSMVGDGKHWGIWVFFWEGDMEECCGFFFFLLLVDVHFGSLKFL